MRLVSTETKRDKGANTVADGDVIGSQSEYVLSISLTDDMLAKLGIDVASLSIGQEVKVAGVGKVTSISSGDYSGVTASSVSVQLTSVGVEPGDEAKKAFDDAFEE